MATSSISYPLSPPCSRPFHAQDARIEPMEDEKQDCDTFINHEECRMSYESEEENYVYVDDDEGEPQKILKRFRGKINEQGHIIHKKLHFKFRRDGTTERKFRQTLHDFKGRVVSDLSQKSSTSDPETSNDDKNTQRGTDIGDILSSNQGGIEEPKLERFKVKAVNIVGVGVVKEEV